MKTAFIASISIVVLTTPTIHRRSNLFRESIFRVLTLSQERYGLAHASVNKIIAITH